MGGAVWRQLDWRDRCAFPRPKSWICHCSWQCLFGPERIKSCYADPQICIQYESMRFWMPLTMCMVETWLCLNLFATSTRPFLKYDTSISHYSHYNYVFSTVWCCWQVEVADKWRSLTSGGRWQTAPSSVVEKRNIETNYEYPSTHTFALTLSHCFHNFCFESIPCLSI